jgi:hypothetical protein
LGAGDLTKRKEFWDDFRGFEAERSKKLFRINVIAIFLAVWAVSGVALAQPAGPDDPIARLLEGGAASDKLPAAPPKPIPTPQTAGPSPGAAPSGQPPVVMSARIGEQTDRTRLVLELSDPVNLRTFTLADPDRVVVDMPEVAWRLGAPPVPNAHGVDQVLSLRPVPRRQFTHRD